MINRKTIVSFIPKHTQSPAEHTAGKTAAFRGEETNV